MISTRDGTTVELANMMVDQLLNPSAATLVATRADGAASSMPARARKCGNCCRLMDRFRFPVPCPPRIDPRRAAFVPSEHTSGRDTPGSQFHER
jgi:hypothetical protein